MMQHLSAFLNGTDSKPRQHDEIILTFYYSLKAGQGQTGLIRVVHTMRKPPETLLASEEARHVATVREVFRGTAREATLRFREFLNVAAALALAGIGFDQTEVRVLADPAVQYSHHEVVAEGTFGSFRFEIENAASIPQRGARLVAMSIVHALLQRRAAFIVG